MGKVKGGARLDQFKSALVLYVGIFKGLETYWRYSS